MKNIFGVEQSKNLIDAVENTKTLAKNLTDKVVTNFATPVLGKGGKVIREEIRNNQDDYPEYYYQASW